MKENKPFAAYQEMFQRWYGTLANREKGAIAVALTLVTILIINSIYEPISNSFQEVNRDILSTKKNFNTASLLIKRYAKLKDKKYRLESEFKESSSQQGVITRLETVLKEKSSVSSDYNFKERQTRDFGDKFKQTVYEISFKSNDYSDIINLLKEITADDFGLLLTDLQIEKSRRGDRLEVKITANSIHSTNSTL